MTRLLTADEFKDLPLGLHDRIIAKLDEGDKVQFYLDAASEEVEATCKRKFAQHDVDEYLDGKGFPRLILSDTPVAYLSSAYTVWSDGTQVAIDNNLLEVQSVNGFLDWKNRAMYKWEHNGVYRVVYTAGYAPVPTAIQLATALWAIELMQPIFQLQSRSQTDREAVQQNIVDLLTPFRRDRWR